MQSLNPINEMMLEQRQKATHLKTAGVFALIAGVDLSLSVYTSYPIIMNFLKQIGVSFGQSLPPAELSGLKLITSALSFLVGLGGFLVIIGGWMFFQKRKSLGKLFLVLGGGMGIFGLIFSMSEVYYMSGFSLLLLHAEYWAGVLLASVAIWVARRA